jgi:hypothetical protein
VSTAPRRLRAPLLLLAAALAAIVAVNAVDLPVTARGLRAAAGGEPVLDLRLGYGPEVASRVLHRLGESGRASYLTMLWTVDLLLPALFGLALWAGLGAGRFSRWRGLALAAAGCDYLENAALSALILGHPRIPPALAVIAATLTVLKFLLYGLAAGLAAAGAVPKGDPA